MTLRLISCVDGRNARTARCGWTTPAMLAFRIKSSLTSPKMAQSQYSKNHSDSNAFFPCVEVDDSTQLVETSLNLVVTAAKVSATSVEGSGQKKES
jgi:hypothetical protein